jgi:2-hydroxy-3-keto-5-methylthiopentenyl-1-phosphate phosphatase
MSHKNIILDFDGTITTKDTISALAGFGIKYQKEQGLDMTQDWEEILQNYEKDYLEHVENYRPSREERKNIGLEIAFNRSLKDIEMRSFQRVSKSGLFRGISNLEWKRAGMTMVESGEVRIRRGFQDFILMMLRQGRKCGIVSVNFSSHFIQGVLEASIGHDALSIELLSNTADQEGLISSLSTTPEGSVMTTSDQKLFSMRRLISSWTNTQTESLSSNTRVIYAGDSGTDIECLLGEGVIGIVISEKGDSSLMATFRRVEVKIAHIEKYHEGEINTLYWASDFQDISKSPLFDLSAKGNI